MSNPRIGESLRGWGALANPSSGVTLSITYADHTDIQYTPARTPGTLRRFRQISHSQISPWEQALIFFSLR